MSLLKVFDVASSAMGAQSVRLNTVASNLSNANNVSSSPSDTYKARVPLFATAYDDARENLFAFTNKSNAMGVKVKAIVESKAPVRPEYNPHHPDANEEGYIFKTNVNPMQEMADMIAASRSFQLNVETLRAAEDMIGKTLNLGK